jgi:hypothetical protein
MNATSIHRAAGRRVLAAAAAALLGGATMAPAATPEEKCQSGKNNTAGLYASCLAKAEKVHVLTGDAMKYGAAVTKCETKYGLLWGKLEQKAVDAGTTCPSTGDQTDIQDFVDACNTSVAEALAGGTLPLNVLDCNEDLDTCTTDLLATNADLSATNADLTVCDANLGACLAAPRLPATGQITCSNGAGTVVPCAGTGQDGDVLAGVGRSFTDNGNGTITDDATGLMWEKLSNDGSIHDKDNQYTWSAAMSTKIATLNADNFGGHNDWRMPNYYELQTLINAEAPPTFPVFDTACPASCTVTDCNCTVGDNYWTSTTSEGTTRSQAYTVRFTTGLGVIMGKGSTTFMRAVRGGGSDPGSCTAGQLAQAQADLDDCNSDLLACATNCDVAIGLPQATGQTTSYGPGSDGDLQKGLGRSFTDNGDGTITDNVTGLMWEKKSDDGGVHDKDNTYTWGMTSPPYTMNGTMVTTFLAALNSGGGFAGYTDWRIPNLNELETIRNLETAGPAAYAEFNNGCTGGCTVTTCSCTRSTYHWSSSTYRNAQGGAWDVYFHDGYTYAGNKTDVFAVRAVRAGS